MKNYYQSLGVEPEASFEDIKKAYRQYAKKFHPDKQNGDEFFEDRFKEIQEAYEVLSSESSRDDYDDSFYSFYARQDGEASKEEADNTLREEYEEKLRNQEAEFRRREQRIKDEFEAKNSQSKSRADTTAGKKTQPQAMPEIKPALENARDISFTVFCIFHIILVLTLCAISEAPVAIYPISYWIVSLYIIQNELGFKRMLINFSIFWLVIPGLALLMLWP